MTAEDSVLSEPSQSDYELMPPANKQPAKTDKQHVSEFSFMQTMAQLIHQYQNTAIFYTNIIRKLIACLSLV